MPVLPILNGLIYPISIPVTKDGDYITLDDEQAKGVSLSARDGVFFTEEGEKKELGTKERAALMEALEKHPGMVAANAMNNSLVKESAAADKSFKLDLSRKKERVDA